ncbi:hypothetical protein DFH06DRAFT_1317124 [Mycena polygramma]|nr:hypothetical protein DFH06DRAFT_1134108 [Mycena polygramma]KAJ7678332.1 hypothetical protein DFH06DRAFT_1317124 [Mycena polygramma]
MSDEHTPDPTNASSAEPASTNSAEPASTSAEEAEIDRQITRLFFAEISDPSPRSRHRDHPNPARNVEGIQTCACCEVHGYLAPLATPTCPRLFVCEDCPEFYRVKKCLNCFVRTHRSHPLHFPTEWNGLFWQRTTLQRLGFVFQLGHRGQPCPSHGEQKTMTVIAANSIHCVNFRCCQCPGHPDQTVQVVKVGWLPGSEGVKCVTLEMLGICSALGVL